MKKIWHDQAWEDYLNLQNDKKLLKKANTLLKDIERPTNWRTLCFTTQKITLVKMPKSEYIYFGGKYHVL